MIILSIETSCDDTGIAILSAKGEPHPEADEPRAQASGWKVLANIIASQIKIHKEYGGVFPAMAKREHQKNLVPVLVKALKEAKLLKLKNKKEEIEESKNKKLKKILDRESELYKKLNLFLQKYEIPNIDLIAVTNGPGLEPCLWVGVNLAKSLSFFWKKPIVPINHIESHILVNFLDLPTQTKNKKIKFPAIALIVSGGHTQLILIKSIGKYKILGETRDDAAGECFDKCAKILGLDYPGGPIISKLAKNAKTSDIKLPRPMLNTKDYDFSFSGLKTAVLYADMKVKNKTAKYKKEMAKEVQQAIIDVLIKKTIKAVKDFNAKSLILGGGVTANKELKKQFKEKLKKESLKTELFAPTPKLSTDNALMIAVAGFFHRKKIKPWQKIKADSNLRIK